MKNTVILHLTCIFLALSCAGGENPLAKLSGGVPGEEESAPATNVRSGSEFFNFCASESESIKYYAQNNTQAVMDYLVGQGNRYTVFSCLDNTELTASLMSQAVSECSSAGFDSVFSGARCSQADSGAGGGNDGTGTTTQGPSTRSKADIIAMMGDYNQVCAPINSMSSVPGDASTTEKVQLWVCQCINYEETNYNFTQCVDFCANDDGCYKVDGSVAGAPIPNPNPDPNPDTDPDPDPDTDPVGGTVNLDPNCGSLYSDHQGIFDNAMNYDLFSSVTNKQELQYCVEKAMKDICIGDACQGDCQGWIIGKLRLYDAAGTEVNNGEAQISCE